MDPVWGEGWVGTCPCREDSMDKDWGQVCKRLVKALHIAKSAEGAEGAEQGGLWAARKSVRGRCLRAILGEQTRANYSRGVD